MKEIVYKIYRKLHYLLSEKEVIYVEIKQGQVRKFKTSYAFQTRAEGFMKMLADAMIQNPWIKTNNTFRFHIGDYPKGKISPNNYYYCCDRKEDVKSVLPCFVFANWPQAGIEDYEQTAKQMAELGEKPYKYNQMLWIGNVKTHKSREEFLKIANANEEKIIGIDTFVDARFDKTGGGREYISLPDHVQYKYLIDIEGRGYSGRLGLLLFSRRPIFIQERKWKQYYMFDLEPYKHFIPVKNDFSDLLSQIEFMENKGVDYYKQIAENAYQFATQNLKYEDAVRRVRKIIIEEKQDN